MHPPPLARPKGHAEEVMCCDSNCCVRSNCCEGINPCSEGWLGVLPILGVFLFAAWSYYVYVFEFCVLVVTIHDDIKFIAYLVVYHILLVYCLVLMLVLIFFKGMWVPEKYFLPLDFCYMLEREDSSSRKYDKLLRFCREREIRIYTRTVTGNIRYCKTCRVVRPDRSHHCSTCGVCVLRMDHHCPWINNCIGFHNHKIFISYLMACCLYCLFYICTTIETCVRFFFEKVDWTCYHLRRIHLILCVFAILIVGMVIFCLFVFHIYLICTNQTTIESMTPPTFASPYEVGFDKGCCANFAESCTWNPLVWCLPINTMSGNGVDFDVVRLD